MASRNYTYQMWPRKSQLEAMDKEFAGCRFAWNYAVGKFLEQDKANQERKEQGLKPEYTLKAASFGYTQLTALKSEPQEWRDGTVHYPVAEMPYASALTDVGNRVFLAYKAVIKRRTQGDPAQFSFKSWRDDQSFTYQVQTTPKRKTLTGNLNKKTGLPEYSLKAFPDELITLTSKPSNRGKAWAALKLPKALGGYVRMRYHRQLPDGSRIDSVTIKHRQGDDTWWATLNVTFADEHLKGVSPDGVLGIDTGFSDCAHFSEPVRWPDGRGIMRSHKRLVLRELSEDEEARKHFLEKRLCEIRESYCTCTYPEDHEDPKKRGKYVKGCRKPGHGDWKTDPEYARRKIQLGTIRQRLTDRNDDLMRRAARGIATQFAHVVMEDNGDQRTKTKIKDKDGDRDVNRRQREARWGTLERYIGELVPVHKVNKAYTSQDCHNCGATHRGADYEDVRPGKGKRFYCKSCGWSGDADFNAAVNILNRGLRGYKTGPESLKRIPEDIPPIEGLSRAVRCRSAPSI